MNERGIDYRGGVGEGRSQFRVKGGEWGEIDDSSTDSWFVYFRRVVVFSFITIIFHSPSISSFFRLTLVGGYF